MLTCSNHDTPIFTTELHEVSDMTNQDANLNDIRQDPSLKNAKSYDRTEVMTAQGILALHALAGISQPGKAHAGAD